MIGLWFGLSFACEVEQQTADAYKPRAAEVTWSDPGGWSGKRFKGMAKERKAAFKRFKKQFASYPAEAQGDILNGVLREDLDEVAAWLAWGAPSWEWDGDEKKCRNLLYAGVGDVDVVLSTCDGATQGLFELGAPIECERLDAVVPRIEKKKRQSADWTAEQMIAVVAGVPQDWMDRDALELAFGKPDRKREKGTVLTFLDDDGVHEGPTVTLVDDRADTWTFPEVALMTRSGEKALRKEAREERLSEARRTVGQLLTAAAAIGMAVAEEQGLSEDRTISHQESSYSNHVRLECNGSVLYEKTFDSREACLAAERGTTFECSGMKMRFGC